MNNPFAQKIKETFDPKNAFGNPEIFKLMAQAVSWEMEQERKRRACGPCDGTGQVTAECEDCDGTGEKQ